VNDSAAATTAKPDQAPNGGADFSTKVPTLGGDRRRGAKVLLRIASRVSRYPVRFAIALMAVVLGTLFQLLIPRFLGQAVDDATGLLAGTDAAAAQSALLTTAALILGTSIARGLFTMLHNYQGEAIGLNIAYQLRLLYFEKLQRLSFSYHDKIHSGDLVTRGMLDIEGVRRFIEHGILRLFQFSLLIGVGSYLYIGSNAVLGAISLAFVPFAVWRAGISRLRLRRLWREFQERMSVLTRIMEENLGGIRVVRSFAGRVHEMGIFNRASADALTISLERVGVRYRNTSMITLSYFMAMVALLWIGGMQVLAGTTTVGELTKYLAFMTILQMPVRQVGMIINGIARASVSGARLFEVLDLEPAVRDRPDAKPLEVRDGVLKFENVGFTYDPGIGEDQTISGITFEVRPGRTLGIVGPPGSGKSTIAHLIPRFYDVTTGRITIDGQDIRDVTLDSLRAAVGVVQQDTFLFASPIAGNVAYGEPLAPLERITGATESAQLHDYIANLPERYDTLVGERGLSLSGGQRQRLSIARSVLLTPAIMVFDDSTAAIDAATERRIRVALKDLTRDRATIIISHRLSSLMHADEILFLESGRIVERGTHDELLARGGRYRDLYDLQVGGLGAPPPQMVAG
jgi:ATP-binding cassette subfamily B multidrug efflux pump